MNPYGSWRRLVRQHFGWILSTLSLGGVSGLFSFSFQDIGRAAATAWQWLSLYQEALLTMKPYWAALGTWGIYASLNQWRLRNTPLTVLSTHVTLELEPSGDARLTRTQEIRANREDVTGYEAIFWTDPGVDEATIPFDTIEMHVDHTTQAQERVVLEGGSGKRWRLMHRFEPIPVGLVKSKIYTRTERYAMRRSFCKSIEWYDLEVPRAYPHKKLALTVYFHRDRPITGANGYRITSDGMVEKPLSKPKDTTRAGWSLVAERPVAGDTYRILWRHEDASASMREDGLQQPPK